MRTRYFSPRRFHQPSATAFLLWISFTILCLAGYMAVDPPNTESEKPITSDSTQQKIRTFGFAELQEPIAVGCVQPNTKTTLRMELRNPFQKSIKILDANASCSCSSISFPHEEVKPGDAFKIELVIDAGGDEIDRAIQGRLLLGIGAIEQEASTDSQARIEFDDTLIVPFQLIVQIRSRCHFVGAQRLEWSRNSTNPMRIVVHNFSDTEWFEPELVVRPAIFNAVASIDVPSCDGSRNGLAGPKQVITFALTETDQFPWADNSRPESMDVTVDVFSKSSPKAICKVLLGSSTIQVQCRAFIEVAPSVIDLDSNDRTQFTLFVISRDQKLTLDPNLIELMFADSQEKITPSELTPMTDRWVRVDVNKDVFQDVASSRIPVIVRGFMDASRSESYEASLIVFKHASEQENDK